MLRFLIHPVVDTNVSGTFDPFTSHGYGLVRLGMVYFCWWGCNNSVLV